MEMHGNKVKVDIDGRFATVLSHILICRRLRHQHWCFVTSMETPTTAAWPKMVRPEICFLFNFHFDFIECCALDVGSYQINVDANKNGWALSRWEICSLPCGSKL